MNTAKFIVANTTFTVTARLSKEGVQFPSDKKGSYSHNEFNIVVKAENGKTSFKFYGSEHDFNNGVTDMSESDLKHALYCFASDSQSAKDNDFDGFCSEFGYDTDSRNAERIYKACGKQWEKWQRITNADIYDVCNELND